MAEKKIDRATFECGLRCVGNFSGPCESMLHLSRGPQLPYTWGGGTMFAGSNEICSQSLCGSVYFPLKGRPWSK